jgi:hypothetical protein
MYPLLRAEEVGRIAASQDYQDHQVKGDLKIRRCEDAEAIQKQQIVFILREAETGHHSIGEVCRAARGRMPMPRAFTAAFVRNV